MKTKKSKNELYSIVFSGLLVLFLSTPFILDALTNQIYKEVKNAELNQNQKLPSFEGGNCLYKVSEVQRWINENQLGLEIVPVNEKIDLLGSPEKETLDQISIFLKNIKLKNKKIVDARIKNQIIILDE